jgi:hypothetical protein
MKVQRHQIVFIPFLNPKRLGGSIQFYSSHQSNLVLSIYLNILSSDEDSAIERKEILEFGLDTG